MRVLVVEDDRVVAEMLKNMIEANGWVCDVAHFGQEALDILRSCNAESKYDIMLVDRVLPDMDGLIELVPRLRCRNSEIPVIFLSALSGIDHKIKAFEFGADDYLVKPPNKNELLARIRAVIRRTRGHNSSLFAFGNFVLDFHKQVCQIKGSSVAIPLTNKEYAMLELLCLYGPGTIVSKEKFINHLYSNNEPSDPKIIDVFMCKLRAKLTKANGTSYITTVWGRGYTLDENVTVTRQGSESSATNSGSESSAEPEGEQIHS